MLFVFFVQCFFQPFGFLYSFTFWGFVCFYIVSYCVVPLSLSFSRCSQTLLKFLCVSCVFLDYRLACLICIMCLQLVFLHIYHTLAFSPACISVIGILHLSLAMLLHVAIVSYAVVTSFSSPLAYLIFLYWVCFCFLFFLSLLWIRCKGWGIIIIMMTTTL